MACENRVVVIGCLYNKQEGNKSKKETKYDG